MIKYTHPRRCRRWVCVHACVCADNVDTHRRVFRFTGAPRALETHIAAYQRTLIAPSKSQQIDVHKSIHKASLTHSLCPSILCLPSPQECVCTCGTHPDSCTLTLTHTHIISSVSHSVTQTAFDSSTGSPSRTMHVKQTVTPALQRRSSCSWE